jgi:hypothetical protein
MHPSRSVRISTTSQPSPDLVAELAFAGTQLQLSLSASRTLRVLEIQGSRSVLDAFGAKKPTSLPGRKAADEPKVAAEKIAASPSIPRADFRWACDLAVAQGGETVLCIPTTKIPTVVPQPGVLAVVYEHKKPTGSVRQQLAVHLSVDVEQVVKPAIGSR